MKIDFKIRVSCDLFIDMPYRVKNSFVHFMMQKLMQDAENL